MDADTAIKQNVSKQGHPKGLYMLFMVEMWERFNYYGMRALLSLFMISTIIGFSKATTSKIYGWFTALVYLTPVIGGYLADKYIGKRHSITIGAILMAAGQFTLASYDIIPARLALGIGLVLIILGNGFFKPNISSIVGELYEPNDPRRDGGFTIFYMGINLGAFFAPFVCGFLGERIAWKYGFAAAGVGMLIGLVWYLLTQNKYLGHIGMQPVSKDTSANHDELNKPLTQEDWDKIKAIFTFVFFAVFFFAFFEQAGTSLTFFAEEATNRWINLPFIGKWQVPTSYFQAINPIFIVLIAPFFSKMWINMGKKGKEPSIPNKFGWGLFLQGLGFLFIAVAAWFFLKDSSPVSMIWITALYMFCTLGELCLSPVGLSMVTKLAPAKFMSLLMGVWLMSSFFGNLLAGWLASYYESWKLTTLFSVPAALSIAFAVTMWFMVRKVKYWMHGVN